jgi:hypothetical protein
MAVRPNADEVDVTFWVVATPVAVPVSVVLTLVSV